MRRKINWILGGLIALISGCKAPLKTAADTKVVALYGVPYATYDISGTVIDTKGKPIADAKVVVKGYNNQAIGDTLQTDKRGKFSTTASDFPSTTINIVASDTHGQHATDSVQHTTSYKKNQEGRGFYRGECEIETTITLKENK